MKFFDYIFYRSYLFYERHKDLPMFSSVIIVASEIIVLTGWAWAGLTDLLLPEIPEHAYFITLVICLLVYLRYRKRVDSIIREFSHSKYNKSIPDWMCIWGTLIPSVILGVVMDACASAYIARHSLSGILWPYIEPYL